MRASEIFFLARTRRCAVVASGSRNARAISRVESPHSVRSASAVCAGALVGILQAIFGKVEIAAQAPDEARENTRALAAHELVDDAAEHARLLIHGCERPHLD